MYMCLNVHLQHISNMCTCVIFQCLREGRNNLICHNYPNKRYNTSYVAITIEY